MPKRLPPYAVVCRPQHHSPTSHEVGMKCCIPAQRLMRTRTVLLQFGANASPGNTSLK